MPHLKIYELPLNTTSFGYDAVKARLKKAVASIPELELNENQIQVTLVAGEGDPDSKVVIVEISQLYDRPERTSEVKKRLARAIGEVIMGGVPICKKIELSVHCVQPEISLWTCSREDLK